MNGGYILLRPGLVAFYPGDFFQFLLDLVGDIQFDIFRRCTGIGGRNQQLAELHLGITVTLDRRQRTHTQENDRKGDKEGQQVTLGEESEKCVDEFGLVGVSGD